MHLYISSVGFSTYNESAFYELLQKNSALLPAGLRDYSRNADRGFSDLPVTDKTAIYSLYKGKELYSCVPHVDGMKYEYAMEVDIERHSLTETFAVCSDSVKQGVTLIFHLINGYDYMIYARERGLDWNVRNTLEIRGMSLGGLAGGGMILLPISKSQKQAEQYSNSMKAREKLIAAAKKGDEEAMESLTIEDLDIYTQLSRRIVQEDVFTIVDSSFMPSGVECDMYSIVGEILSVEIQDNVYSGEEVCVMLLDCYDLKIRVAINLKNLLGEPAVGRRFKGQIWLHGEVMF